MNVIALVGYLVLSHAVQYITSTSDSLNKGLFFSSLPGYKLSVSMNPKSISSKKVQVKDRMDSVFSCFGVPWCLSINFKISSDSQGLHDCELMSIDKFNNSLTIDDKYIHLSFENPCEYKPCLNEGICIVEYNRHDYCCQCKAGYTGENCEEDVNECLGSHGCHSNARCENSVGTFKCICNTGYTGDGKRCKDINECLGLHGCHSSARCENNVGSYRCVCNTGYAGDGRSCSDVNECLAFHGCHSNARCENNVGSYRCVCNTGYTGDGRSCSDVNECLASHGCHSNARCENSVGSYRCVCNTGYAGDGRSCSDVNECVASHGCHSNARCENNVGSYRCVCNNGYAGDGRSCSDINECAASHGCHSNARCENTAGSYRCVCNSGYVGDGRSCSIASGVWQEYTPYICGSGRSLLQQGKTKEECKQLCTGDCISVEWWGTGSRNCYKCPNPSGRHSYTVTHDASYPPYVLIKP